jgi:pilus assembly protein Flp/PilA
MFTYLRAWLASKGWLTRKEEGASLVEYALLVSLIAVFCVAAITLLGTNIAAIFNYIAGKLTVPS